MRPWGTLRLTIRVRSCGAIGCIRYSVAAPACPCTSWPAHTHDARFTRPLLELAVHLYHLHPRIIRLDAAYWGLQLIRLSPRCGWRAIAVVPWNPKRQKNRTCLPRAL